MKIGNKKFIETIGIFGVIASLIFVGVQLYYDRTVALGAAYQDRADSRKEDLRVRFESDSHAADIRNQIKRGFYPAWWNEGVATMHEEGYSIEALSRWALRVQLDLYQLDNLLYQHELGLIDDSLIDSVMNRWGLSASGLNSLAAGVLGMRSVRPEVYAALESVGFSEN